MALIAIFLLVMFLLCITGELVLYQKVRQILKGGGGRVNLRTISLSVIAVRRAREETSAANRQDTSVSTDEQRRSAADRDEPFTLNVQHVTSQSISELELEAAQTLTAGILSLTCVVGPFIIFTFTLFICKILGSDACRTIAWMAPFFKELIVVHAVYHPIIFIRKSNEFSAALKNRFER